MKLQYKGECCQSQPALQAKSGLPADGPPRFRDCPTATRHGATPQRRLLRSSTPNKDAVGASYDSRATQAPDLGNHGRMLDSIQTLGGWAASVTPPVEKKSQHVECFQLSRNGHIHLHTCRCMCKGVLLSSRARGSLISDLGVKESTTLTESAKGETRQMARAKPLACNVFILEWA